MGAHTIRRVAASLAAVLATAPYAAERAAGQAEPALPVVKVFADRYEAGGRRFARLDQLEQWVKTSNARGLVFHSCITASTKPVLAAFERFQHLYLDIRWSLPGEAGCPKRGPDRR